METVGIEAPWRPGLFSGGLEARLSVWSGGGEFQLFRRVSGDFWPIPAELGETSGIKDAPLYSIYKFYVVSLG